MNEQPLGSAERREVAELLAHYGAPAYVRRARGVEEAWEGLLAQCRRKREEWLPMVRLSLARLRDLAGDLEALRPLLGDKQVAMVESLLVELRPQLRLPLEPTTSVRALRRAVRELTTSLERFNRRWLRFVPEIDLDPVNALRADYNRYYLLEKECALRSPALARRGYRPLEPLTLADVEAVLSPLPVPRLLR
jgi:hypothetical protein